MMDKVKNVPELRFAGFTDDWKQRKLRDFLTESRIIGSNGKSAKKLTIKLWKKGVVPKEEIYSGSLATQYFIRKSGQFIYGKLDFLNQAFGIIPPELDGYETTLDAPAFDIDQNVNSKFLLEYIARDNFYLHYGSMANGSRKARRVHVNTVLDMPFIAPSFEEQKAIGDFFKQLDSTIDFHQREWEKYKNLKISYLEKMFPRENQHQPELRFRNFTDPWVQRKLSEISISYSGGTPTASNHKFYNGTIPFIRSGEINSFSTELFINEEGLNQSSAKMVSKGDILYALYGATSGEVGISKINGAINQAILAIKPLKNFDANFISQWLRKNKPNIIQTFLQGGQGNLSGDIVKNLNLSIPNSIAEQQAIGEFFRQLDDTITTHQRNLEKLKKLKEGYLQKMFV